MSQKQATRNAITLRGSTQIISQSTGVSTTYILYHRGIYPADNFHTVKKYGQPVLLTEDPNLEAYLSNILKQLETWLMNKKINKLVLVVLSVDTRVVLERWEFDIHISQPEIGEDGAIPARPEKEMRREIRAILKQVVGSNVYMPTLSDPCIFDILAYTEGNAEVPVEEWRDTHGHLIEAGKTQTVKLKSFDTSLHRIDAMVAYRYEG